MKTFNAKAQRSTDAKFSIRNFLRLCALRLALKVMTQIIITGAKGRMGQALDLVREKLSRFENRRRD